MVAIQFDSDCNVLENLKVNGLVHLRLYPSKYFCRWVNKFSKYLNTWNFYIFYCDTVVLLGLKLTTFPQRIREKLGKPEANLMLIA